MNDVLRLLRSHRSIRRFEDADVPDEDVQRAVEAGQMASTSSAVQSYCLIRVRDADTRRRLAELTGPQEKVALAGAFFAICGDTRRHRLACARDGYTYDARLEAFLLAAIDTSLFAEKLVIAFESMGYGICYIGGLRNKLPEADALLELPEGVYPFYGLCVGKPAESPSERPRLPADAILFDERYADDETMLGLLADYDERYRAYLKERGASSVEGWSQRMARKFSAPERSELGPYYRSKGADFR